MTRLQSIDTWNDGKRTTEVPCFDCGKLIRKDQTGVADLDGIAYRAYYHTEHAPKVLCAIDGRTDHNTDAHDALWGWNGATYTGVQTCGHDNANFPLYGVNYCLKCAPYAWANFTHTG